MSRYEGFQRVFNVRNEMAGEEFFDLSRQASLAELLNFIDTEILHEPDRTTFWLIGEAMAYQQLKGKDSKGLLAKVEKQYSLDDHRRTLRVQRELRGYFPKSPIDADGLAHSQGTVGKLPLIVEFIEMSDRLYDSEFDPLQILDISTRYDALKKTKKREFKKIKRIAKKCHSPGMLFPEVYHTIKLAESYRALDDFESNSIVNCFYTRSAEILRKNTVIYEGTISQEDVNKLSSLIDTLRSSRFAMQA